MEFREHGRTYKQSQHNAAQQKFLESVKSPEDVYIKAAEWMKKFNNFDVEIKQENLKYNKLTSNTHNCPIGKMTNWRCDEDKPRGYPGWSAHWIIGISEKDYEETHSFSDFFKSHNFPKQKINPLLGIHISSGGAYYRPASGEQECYLHYYVYFFADNFPGLQRHLLKKKLRS